MRYVQQLFDGSTGETLQIEVDFVTHALDGVVHGSMEALTAAYVARMATLVHEGWLELDGVPLRLRDLAAIRDRGPRVQVPEHPAMLRLRERLVEAGWDPVFAGGVEYVVGLASGSEAVAVGGCRSGGRPDLPPELVWPGRRLFLAQIDLRQIAPFDVAGLLPPVGMLYCFVSEDCTDNVALCWPSHDGLAPRDPPDGSLLRERALVPFPAIRAEHADGQVPDEALRELSAALGFDVVHDDPGCRLFGTPSGELGWVSLGLPEPADALDPASFVRYDGPYVLALQVPFAEGFVFVGVPPGDLRRGELVDARATYWGT